MFSKKNVESSPQEIWTRIRFLEISGSPSLEKSKNYNISIKILQAQLENLKITQGQGCKVALIKKCLDIVVCSLNSYIEL